jgi:DNA-binding FadR family transcriptional regulator
MKPLLPMIILDKKNLVDIYVARLAIESKTAELAALNSTAQDISDLNDIMKLMENAYRQNNFEQYHINDFNFHLMIAKVGKNAILYKILEVIQDLLNCSIVAASEEASFIELSIKIHKLIIDSITNREPEKAVEYMVSHLNGGMNYLKK